MLCYKQSLASYKYDTLKECFIAFRRSKPKCGHGFWKRWSSIAVTKNFIPLNIHLLAVTVTCDRTITAYEGKKQIKNSMTGAQFAGMKASALTPAHRRQTASQISATRKAYPLLLGLYMYEQ